MICCSVLYVCWCYVGCVGRSVLVEYVDGSLTVCSHSGSGVLDVSWWGVAGVVLA